MSIMQRHELTTLAQIVEEAANVIAAIPPEVYDKMQARIWLSDELSGSAGMLRDERFLGKVEMQRKAKLWDDLMSLCGHWQDGSSTTVTFSDDDATRTYHIEVGKSKFYGGSFEQAMRDAILRFPREDDL